MLNSCLIADNLSYDRELNGHKFKANLSVTALTQIAQTIADKPVWVNHEEGEIGTVIKAECSKMSAPPNLSELDQKIINRHGGYYCVFAVFRSSAAISNMLKGAEIGCSVAFIPADMQWHGQSLEFNSSRAYELSLCKEGAIDAAKVIRSGIPEITIEQSLKQLQAAVKPAVKPAVKHRTPRRFVVGNILITDFG
jgi:hypothetical protein